MLGIGDWVLWLVGGASTGEKNNFIKVRHGSCLLGNFNVATMNGVETAAEDCNFLFQGGGGVLGYVF